MTIISLLLCLALSGGAEQRVYLVESAAPAEVTLYDGATVRRFAAEDGAGGVRETITLTLPPNSSAAIGGERVGLWQLRLPWVVK